MRPPRTTPDWPRLAATAFALFLAGCRPSASTPPAPAPAPSPAPTSLQVTLVATWGAVPADSQFNLPSGVAVGPDGSVYVADTLRDRILKFLPTGAPALVWSVLADGTRLRRPSGLAVDDAGAVYVADTGNHRIVKLTAAGVLTTTWGGSGGEPGRLNSPSALAVDRSRAVYVADAKNHRVQKFSAAGRPLTTWGQYGSAAGQFNAPGGIAVDRTALYVTDTWNHRVQKFDQTGRYLREWGRLGRGDGRFNTPTGIAVDRAGKVYVISAGLQPTPPRNVADTLRVQRVQVFTGAGEFLHAWGRAGSRVGEFDRAMALALDRAGNVYVADTENHRVQKFGSSGAALRRWGVLPPAVFKHPSALAADGADGLYVADQGNSRIVKVDSSGTIVAARRFADTVMIEDVAVDARGHLHVALTDGGVAAVRTLDAAGSVRGETRGFGAIKGIAANGRGHLYVSDWQQGKIHRLTLDRQPAGGWSLDFPGDLTVDRAGSIYAVERGRHRVVKLDADGRVLATWGEQGRGEGQVLDGTIAVDAKGRVYLADPLTQRVIVFGPRGGVLGAWGSWGSAGGQFYQPRAIAVDGAGRVYVAEPLLNRVLVFTVIGLPD